MRASVYSHVCVRVSASLYVRVCVRAFRVCLHTYIHMDMYFCVRKECVSVLHFFSLCMYPNANEYVSVSVCALIQCACICRCVGMMYSFMCVYRYIHAWAGLFMY